MSLRGEQDDLNWYDIYGPNVPYAELDKEPPVTMTTEAKSPDVLPKPEAADQSANETTDKPSDDGKFDVAVDAKVATPVEKKVEVVEVTVDGRFGHANHSRDETLKAAVRKGLTPDIKVEGLVESADAI